MAVTQCSCISSFVEANLLMQVVKSVSKNDLSKNRRPFLPSLKIRPYSVRCMSGKKRSSQNRNSDMCLLRSSLISVFSTF